MPERTLFLTLRIFSATGGIEKVSRVAGKALQDIANNDKGSSLKVFSMYDQQGDIEERYFGAGIFRGFRKQKAKFVYAAIREGIGCKQVILSHSNLLLAGWLIKMFSPKTRLILLAHGIEVWSPFSMFKNKMLKNCDLVLAVSSFTKARMMAVHGLEAEKIIILNNCLDPFLQPPLPPVKNPQLLQRYGLNPADIVLITLTRLSFKERYKGYDNVLYAVKELKKDYPRIRYLILGKYDAAEKERVDAVVTSLQLEDNIIFTGFIAEEELAVHYNIADLYIMPSKKEGFGIVFIEAMYYGKPVIAGNKDGSVDALDNGKLGLLINPDNRQEITDAIIKVICNKHAFVIDPKVVMAKFGFPAYKEQLKKILY
ncbi:MAG: glycosyltransferase family 4 protein [Ferruginibacter sp.]|nr:glycosyltransferase family 4 protein [Ferruginibacter sp.]